MEKNLKISIHFLGQKFRVRGKNTSTTNIFQNDQVGGKKRFIREPWFFLLNGREPRNPYRSRREPVQKIL